MPRPRGDGADAVRVRQPRAGAIGGGARRFSRDDVERLRRRKAGRRDPDAAAAEALRWGLPVLESGITLIADNTLFYRGHDAIEIARSHSVAEVASLVWTGSFVHTFGSLAPLPAMPPADRRLPFI